MKTCPIVHDITLLYRIIVIISPYWQTYDRIFSRRMVSLRDFELVKAHNAFISIVFNINFVPVSMPIL